MVDVANIHLPVLLDDCVNLMAPALEHENAIAVDCTLGLAGHSIAFLKAAPQARLIGIDRDSEALGLATERMEREGLADRFIPVHAAFDQLDQVLADQDIERVDAVFMDLGLSSLQIDETDRGFSYSHDAPLDMRMDVSQPLTAERILATYDAAELCRSLFWVKFWLTDQYQRVRLSDRYSNANDILIPSLSFIKTYVRYLYFNRRTYFRQSYF